MSLSKLVVVGGNGFIGSAICRLALARGLKVTSVSSSGRPYQTPKGHTPAWTTQVDWQKGDAFQPESIAPHLDGAAGVVHTLGILLEHDGYKKAVRDADAPALLKSLFGGGRNPLEQPSVSYERMNRDSALAVCEAFVASKPPPEQHGARPFVFVSAEDVFRPWVPARYIETKREAERRLADILASQPTGFRGVYLRPGLVYHAHLRPLTTPAAAIFDLTATIHSQLPMSLREPMRAGLGMLPRSGASPSAAVSVANALTTHPLHVDHVASAVVRAVNTADIHGVVGVKEIRELMGWVEPENTAAVT